MDRVFGAEDDGVPPSAAQLIEDYGRRAPVDGLQNEKRRAARQNPQRRFEAVEDRGKVAAGEGRAAGRLQRNTEGDDSEGEDHGFALGGRDSDGEHEIGADIFRGDDTKKRRQRTGKDEQLYRRSRPRPKAPGADMSRGDDDSWGLE